MFWKIFGAVVVVWLVFVLVGWLIKGLFWLITLGAISAGIYLLYKVAAGADKPQHR